MFLQISRSRAIISNIKYKKETQIPIQIYKNEIKRSYSNLELLSLNTQQVNTQQVNTSLKEEDNIISTYGLENCAILENYVSFMETINYLSIPITERIIPNMKQYFDFDFNDEKGLQIFIETSYIHNIHQ